MDADEDWLFEQIGVLGALPWVPLQCYENSRFEYSCLFFH